MESVQVTINGEPNMLYKHFTEKLLGLQGLNITNIEENCTVVNDRLHFSQKNMMKTKLNKILDVLRSRRRRETSKIGTGYIIPR